MAATSSSGVPQPVLALRALNGVETRIGRTVEMEDDGLAPHIRRGDVLGFVPLASRHDVRPGDVVQFRFRDRTYIRRFDRRDGTDAVMCDAVGYEDVVPLSDVIGRAYWCTRDGKELWLAGVRDTTPRPMMEQVRRLYRRLLGR